MPIVGSCENDALTLCRVYAQETAWPEPPAPLTGVVDAAIELFAALLPLQDPASSAQVITHLTQSIRSPKLERNLGRKAAASVNVSMCILLALRNGAQSRSAKDMFSNTQLATSLADLIKVSLHKTRRFICLLILRLF